MATNLPNVSLKPTSDLTPEALKRALEEMKRAQSALLDLPNSTKDLNLDQELAQHYARVRQYQSDLQYDEEIPANQMAQVFNTLTQVLAQIIKLQQTVQNIKRMDEVESALVDAMQACPDEVKEEFFKHYDNIIKRYES